MFCCHHGYQHRKVERTFINPTYLRQARANGLPWSPMVSHSWMYENGSVPEPKWLRYHRYGGTHSCHHGYQHRKVERTFINPTYLRQARAKRGIRNIREFINDILSFICSQGRRRMKPYKASYKSKAQQAFGDMCHESDSIRGHTDSSKNKSRMFVLCEFKFFELPGSEGTLTIPRTKVECLFFVNSSSLNCQGPRAH